MAQIPKRAASFQQILAKLQYGNLINRNVRNSSIIVRSYLTETHKYDVIHHDYYTEIFNGDNIFESATHADLK